MTWSVKIEQELKLMKHIDKKKGLAPNCCFPKSIKEKGIISFIVFYMKVDFRNWNPQISFSLESDPIYKEIKCGKSFMQYYNLASQQLYDQLLSNMVDVKKVSYVSSPL